MVLTIIWMVVWAIVALVIGGAVLGVVRAALETPPLSALRPYANLIYALFVLLVILVCVWLVTSNSFPYAGWHRG